MDSTLFISPTMDIIIFPLTILFFIAWIIRRRIIRRKGIIVDKLEKRPYTISQIFGIIGILFFILPIFYVVGVMLQRGLYILYILLFGSVKSPNTVDMTIKTIFYVLTTFLIYTGVYIVCEMMWPKRFIGKVELGVDKSIDPQKTVD